MKNYFKQLSTKLFDTLTADEELSAELHSEESFFVRFNHGQVRQNTNVQQHTVSFLFQKQKRTFRFSVHLTLEASLDHKNTLDLLQSYRAQLPMTDENPQYFPLQNGGTSETIKKDLRPTDEQIVLDIVSTFKGSDLVGFLCCGPLRSASANSKGQFHYFEHDFFFFDYSVYDGPRAAKGFYSAPTWNMNEFHEQAQLTLKKLNLLGRPLQEKSRGKYRVYLEPMAVAEIAGILGWGAFSQAAYNQGRSPLKQFVDGQNKFNSQVTIQENFDLGFSPPFNSFGEVSKKIVPLVENGNLTQLLISTSTAQEYGLISNQASPWEAPRSLEIRAGTLKKENILRELGTGLYLSNLHYINWSDPQNARITGMTRFACFWVENGEILGPIKDLRFDETLYNIFGSQLVAITDFQESFVDISTYTSRNLGGLRVPGLLVNDFNFTL